MEDTTDMIDMEGMIGMTDTVIMEWEVYSEAEAAGMAHQTVLEEALQMVVEQEESGKIIIGR